MCVKPTNLSVRILEEPAYFKDTFTSRERINFFYWRYKFNYKVRSILVCIDPSWFPILKKIHLLFFIWNKSSFLHQHSIPCLSPKNMAQCHHWCLIVQTYTMVWKLNEYTYICNLFLIFYISLNFGSSWLISMMRLSAVIKKNPYKSLRSKKCLW